jgi:hypothetical protein
VGVDWRLGVITPSLIGSIAARRRGGGGVVSDPAETDPHFANVVALLHLDGVDAATTFTDVKGHTFSASANAQIDTAQSKFGGASLLLDGTGDRISSADHADWELGTDDFTIECFIRTTTIAAGTDDIISKRAGSTVGSYLIYRSGANLQIYLSSDGATWNIANGVGFGTISADTWYHVALVREGTAFRAYLDGVGVSIATSASGLVNNAAALNIGGNSGGTEDFSGWIDEVRITKGVARYFGSPTNFTPPSAAFPDS